VWRLMLGVWHRVVPMDTRWRRVRRVAASLRRGLCVRMGVGRRSRTPPVVVPAVLALSELTRHITVIAYVTQITRVAWFAGIM